MRTKSLLARLAVCCAVAAVLAGCASEDPQVSSLDDYNLGRDKALSATGSPQQAILDARTSESGNFVTNGAVTLDDWRHFDTNAEPKADLGAPDENDNAQMNVTEFPTQAATNFKPYSIFRDSEQTNNNDFLWEEEGFQPHGLWFFTIPF